MFSALHITTIAFMGMLIGIAVAIMMLLNWRIQKKQAGVAFWGAGFVMGATGIILIGLRPYLPAWLSILVPNVLIQAFWLALWIGMRRFADKPSNGTRMAATLLIIICLDSYFIYVDPSVSARVVVFCIFNAATTALCARELFRREPSRKKSGLFLAGGWVCLIHIGFTAARFVETVKSAPLEDLLKAGAIHKLAFIEGIIIPLILAFLLLMMTSQRLSEELESHQEELEILASTDVLSGTGNRRHFVEAASREIDRARRYSRPLSIIMLDVDHFKHINDTHGHQCGDAVISTLGQLLVNKVRSQDIVCRIGGEEFAVLMPETARADAAVIAERLRQALSTMPVTFGDHQEIVCTASFGVAELSNDDKNIYDLLPRADKGLYYAKHQGRNCIVVN